MKLIEHFIDGVIRLRWLVIILAIAASFGLAGGMSRLQFANDYHVFFGPDNPELLQFDAFQDVYTKNDNILFVVQAPNEDAFSPRMAALIEDLTARAWSIPYATRVDSVSNFQRTYSDGQAIVVEDLVRDARSLTSAQLAERRAIALEEPTVAGNILSRDARTAGVNITFQLPGERIEELPETVAVAREIAAEIQTRHPDVRVALSGVGMFSNAMAEAGQGDASSLVPIMYLVMIVVAILGLRSMSAAFVTVVVLVLSTVSALGVAGFLGMQLAPITVAAPNIILTLAVADCVHIVVSTRRALREGKDRREAVRYAMRSNFLAVSVTSLTTIIGFISLNFSDAPPLQALGTITAVGIAAAWLLSITLAPAMLSVLPLKPARQPRASLFDTPLAWLGEFVIARRTAVLVSFLALTIGFTALATTNRLDDTFPQYLDQRMTARQDNDFAIENLRSFDMFEFSLDAGRAAGVSDPAYLQRLEAFTAWLRAQPEVMHVFSYSDIIKRLNMNMHDDDPAFRRIPDSPELAAQYLLLYELSLPFGLDLNDRISVDRSATRVTATLHSISTSSQRAFMDRAEAWLRENFPTATQARPTGASVMFAYISQRNIESMISGTLYAALIIAVVMMLCLRSIGMGLLSLAPNILPVAVTFGIWALLVGEIGMAAAIIGSTSLGVVVDDTVHFLTKYLHARRAMGADRAEAVRYAYAHVGEAVILTTLILAIGFAALATSLFRINQQLGELTAIAISVALLFELFLLPALLLIGYRPRPATASERIENVLQPI